MRKEQQLAKAYFRIEEIEKDYKLFEQKYFDFIDEEIMFLIKKFCRHEQDRMNRYRGKNDNDDNPP